MTIYVYKAIFGNYDHAPKPISSSLKKNAVFILLSDRKISIDGWDTIVIKNKDSVIANRHCKMFPWEYFNARESIYIDGHIEFGHRFADLISELSQQNHNFAVMRHRQKGTIVNELVRCIDNEKLSRNQITSVLKSDLLLDFPAVECGMIYRKHDLEVVRDHAERWWWYFIHVCRRDQLSVHSAAKDVSLTINILSYDFSNKDFFKLVGHRLRAINLIKTRLKIAYRALVKGTLLRQ